MARLWVALSGGVDSAIAAAKLIAGGHDLASVTLRLMKPGEQRSHDEALRNAEKVAAQLDIPHREIDASAEFSERILGYIADAYAGGITPNPCVRCNEEIKFGILLEKAAESGVEGLATGHYAKIVDEDGSHRLARGIDGDKDQSYFLYRLGPSALDRVLFPLGEMTKQQVREAAHTHGFDWVAELPESQDVCFATDASILDEVSKRRPEAIRPGPIVDAAGEVVGSHEGIAAFTVGQRKGLGIGGSGPYYVTAIDPETSTVHVGAASDLDVSVVLARRALWHGEPDRDVSCSAQVRYRGRPVGGVASMDGDKLTVKLDEEIRGAALGQSVVCYRGDVVLGGGEIWGTS